MAEDMNVLILSCGTRNKIVQYFKKVFAGKGMVLAADCSSLAPALYEANDNEAITYNESIDLSTCLTKKMNA